MLSSLRYARLTNYPDPVIQNDSTIDLKDSLQCLKPVSVRHNGYPVFDLCKSWIFCLQRAPDPLLDPALYPAFNIYPVIDYTYEAASINGKTLELSVRLSAYPVFDLCERSQIIPFRSADIL